MSDPPWEIHDSDSVLHEHRRHCRVFDFHERFAAAEIGDDFTPVEVVSRFRIDDSPLLWYTADKSQIVVDARRFTQLEAVDGTRGRQAAIGRLLLAPAAAAAAGLDGRTLLEFLIRAAVIQTFMHMSATVRIVHESTDGDGCYRALLGGSHIYFTNERNEDPLSFEFRLASDGAMSIAEAPEVEPMAEEGQEKGV